MGQLGPFFLFLPVLGGFLLPIGLLWEVLGGLGGLGVPVWVFPGALKPTVRVYCRRRVRAVWLVGRCPGGEAVGEDVSAGRLEVLRLGRRGGFFGLGTFDREGLFEVVSGG